MPLRGASKALDSLGLTERSDGPLRHGAKNFLPSGDGKHLALAYSLAPACVNDAGPGNQLLAPGRTEIVDLELRCHNGRAERGASREGERVVRGVRDDSAMNKAMLLLDLIGDRDPQLDRPCLKQRDLGIQQNAERLRAKCLLRGFKGELHWRADPRLCDA